MFRTKLISAILALSVVILFIGCSKAPSDLAEKTHLAIDEAQAAEADIYFPLKFMALRDSFNVAQAEIEQEKANFFLRRNYDHAAKLLAQVNAEMTALTEKTALKKEETKLQVQQMLVDMNAAIEVARASMKDAARIRKNRDWVSSYDIEVTAIESEIPVLTQLLQGEQYLTAANKASVHLEKLNQIQAGLQSLGGK
ncbi:hypothetical protein JXA02_14805 [candidate division KSB1 bacterium]|nr:hypothetical protein [candidate division KSB1 bacterium]